jgi:hypothetical protein
MPEADTMISISAPIPSRIARSGARVCPKKNNPPITTIASTATVPMIHNAFVGQRRDELLDRRRVRRAPCRSPPRPAARPRAPARRRRTRRPRPSKRSKRSGLDSATREAFSGRGFSTVETGRRLAGRCRRARRARRRSDQRPRGRRFRRRGRRAWAREDRSGLRCPALGRARGRRSVRACTTTALGLSRLARGPATSAARHERTARHRLGALVDGRALALPARGVSSAACGAGSAPTSSSAARPADAISETIATATSAARRARPPTGRRRTARVAGCSAWRSAPRWRARRAVPSGSAGSAHDAGPWPAASAAKCSS